jgi:SH3-like domain-containing protein
MIMRGLLLVGLLGLAAPVMAQSQSSSGVLQLPSKTPPPPARPVHPPQAAPTAPVRRVAPFSTPVHHPDSQLGHSAPGKPRFKPRPRRTPVLRAPRNTHAQKPPAPPPQAAKPLTAPPPANPPPRSSPAPATAPPEPSKGSTTGLPLPRWAALRADEVNMRSGPGTRYPVEWVYRRRDLPMEILREFDVWRLVKDQDGVMGWMHQATLVERRNFVVRGKQAVLRTTAAENAAAVALLQPGVVGRIRSCAAGQDWCQVEVDGYRGWLRREDFWGSFPGEAVN